jgi:hypothetical protein
MRAVGHAEAEERFAAVVQSPRSNMEPGQILLEKCPTVAGKEVLDCALLGEPRDKEIVGLRIAPIRRTPSDAPPGVEGASERRMHADRTLDPGFGRPLALHSTAPGTTDGEAAERPHLRLVVTPSERRDLADPEACEEREVVEDAAPFGRLRAHEKGLDLPVGENGLASVPLWAVSVERTKPLGEQGGVRREQAIAHRVSEATKEHTQNVSLRTRGEVRLSEPERVGDDALPFEIPNSLVTKGAHQMAQIAAIARATP